MSRLAQFTASVRSRLFMKAAVFAIAVGLLFLSITHIRDIRSLEQYFDSAEERPVEIFDFKDTGEEERCFDSQSSTLDPIPKIVHLVWLEDPELNFLTYLTIRSVIVSIKPERINLHYTSLNETNEWFLEVRDHLYLVQHDLHEEYREQVEGDWELKHITDLLRLDALYKEGGIYLDMDVLALRPFDNLLNSETDAVLGHEGADRNAVTNSVIVGRRGSSFIQRWRASYGNFTSEEENYDAVILPKELSLRYPNETCTLSPVAFSWPTWTKRHIEYMHEHLSASESKEFALEIVSHNGRVKQNQMAYHGWSHVASSHLDRLNKQNVMGVDTRFNILARRFLT